MTEAETSSSKAGFLHGIRVLELANELGEYCGKELAGLGAEVVKVEPPAGETTRGYGPFYEDRPGPERSLHFWHYNFGKLGITLDLDQPEDQQRFRQLAQRFDVIIETRERGYLEARGLSVDQLRELNPGLVVARISPFGDDGPWADYKASDLVHLALGGVAMNNGYDPDPSGHYETPPVAPQMWQAYHIAGEMTAMAIIGALASRLQSGTGQYLSTAVHDAVAKQSEGDVPNWIFSRVVHHRKTCRHSMPGVLNGITVTKDGRWLLPSHTYDGSPAGQSGFESTVAILDKYGLADDLVEPIFQDPAHRAIPSVNRHIVDVVERFVRRFMFEREVWRDFQEVGQTWAPERRPEESLTDEHWLARDTFFEVEHPELGQTFTEVGAKWMCNQVPWRRGPRAPLLGEHNEAVLGELGVAAPQPSRVPAKVEVAPLSRRNKPFALSGVRVIDLSWLLASGGASRYLSALGAEVIKVEHLSKPDFIRWGTGTVPPGGRAEREAMTTSREVMPPRAESPNRAGFFMDINAGRRAISLNLKTERGKELLAELLADADIVAEGFSPGTMDRLGFGYEDLKQLNPRIIYAQQSGMGQIGTYGRFRSFGPVAAGFSGLSEMSGLPEPFPPAGIGYSYLDWFGAYNLAIAMLAALYRQRRTGKGCWIDSSQVESGTYLLGSAILDYSANARRWRRYGNRSPYKPAAPHGIYRCAGEDRWIAISCFNDGEWSAMLDVLASPAWSNQARFATLEGRLAHQDELDRLLEASTKNEEPFSLMERLQAVGVPAGVCETAEDRCERDPQLAHLEWLVELEQTEIGRWPAKEFPVKFSDTPAYMGGLIDRHGPNYGEDNDYVYGEILGLSSKEIGDLAEQGVI